MPTSTEPFELRKDAQDLLFREARTANTFSDEPVTSDQIRAIHDLVKYGPTSMNMQPLRITLLRSAESRARLVPLMSEGNQGKTASAPLVAVLSADVDFHETLGRVFPVKPNAREIFAADEAKRERDARLNASMQVAYFIIGIRAVGLAAGPMSGFDADAVDREFFTGTAQQSLVVVNIGHPGPNPWGERLPRHEFDDIVTEL
ncbi:nitroreductase [Lipingzhangella halophila]|uniref:Nitroreductase n=1 Tax=Lipingzhangella halophila TaxID=1783352 RepID=A0A7W7RL20_9ACTN|nr:malonic semialdehyde reductase [Lipingzhangella halophila]MBB4933935.1 nitroreductase [Lipingzhangella halophila]